MNDFIAAALMQADPASIIAIFVGSIIGIIFGAIPGLTYTMALSMVLPLTFGISPSAAICMLMSTYIGGLTGGSLTACLIGIPGTPSAAATVVDGYAMVRKGQAGLSLGLVIMASAFGSIFSLLVMVFAVDFVAKAAVHFGPVELFSLVLFGMSLICGLSEGSIVKGLIAGTIGLMIMTIGVDDIEGVQRLTFGWTPLLQGVNLVVAMVGLFAVPHLIKTLVDFRLNKIQKHQLNDVKTQMPKFKTLKDNFGLLSYTSVIGTVIGAIPGTGGPIAAFVAYDQAKRLAKGKAKEQFGKGSVQGVLAPEAANNAVSGGAIIPLLSLGIPGDAATAVILGGLLIHGVTPGPALFTENKSLVYLIYITFFVATVVVMLLQAYGVKFFIKLLKIPPQYLMVGIMIMCVIGTYAIRNSFFDVYTMIIIGLFGYLLLLAKIPVTPVVLGLVLGPTLEKEFRTAMILSENDYSVFFTSPLAVTLYILIVVFVGMQLYADRKLKKAALEDAKSLPTVAS